jgi:hypothetical protein
MSDDAPEVKAAQFDKTRARFMFVEMADAIAEVRKRGGKWKPAADGIEWAANEIRRLEALVLTQKQQIERLQAKLPPAYIGPLTGECES